MFIVLYILVAAILLYHVVKLFFKRAYIYIYAGEQGNKRPVKVAYIGSDGTIIDLTQPKGSQRVGQVYLKEGNGVVRVYRKGAVKAEYEELGYVSSGGVIFSSDGTEISRISPEGERFWYELFLRRHADVPSGSSDPVGKCIETGRFRPGEINTATLLARAGAALVLYSQSMKGRSEAPRLVPESFSDTALLSSLLFTILFFIPGLTDLFEKYYVLFPILGKKISYAVSVFLIYLLVWEVLHAIKIAWLSTSDRAYAYLTLINRQTGIERWGTFGILLSIVAAITAFLADYRYVPLFLGILVGFYTSRSFADGSPWYVEPRSRQYSEDEEEIPETGTEKRDYAWVLDSSVTEADFSISLYFDPQEIERLRAENPFSADPQNAVNQVKSVTKDIVLKGETAQQIEHLAAYLARRSAMLGLTRVEELQAALDFVQTPNIGYIVDEECAELHYPSEYFRYPIETMYDKRGDCDCKSVLAAALIRALGYPVLVLVSFQASHAAIAVGGAPELDDMEDLFFITHNNRRYYYCETTGDGWTIGQESDLGRQMRDDRAAVLELTTTGSVIVD